MVSLKVLCKSAAFIVGIGVWASLFGAPIKGFDRSKFLIGADHLNEAARTERHVLEAKECGIDYLIVVWKDCVDLHDWLEKYGMGAVTWDVLPPMWDEKTGKPLKGESVCADAVKSWPLHPATWFINITDEPPVHKYDLCGRIAARLHRVTPDRTPYLCMFPSYAYGNWDKPEDKRKFLGADTYEQYIEEFCRRVPLDYINFDFYYHAYHIVGAWYENLRLVADACRRTGRSLWVTMQANSPRKDDFVTENQLRFQAFSAMAFGAESIIWACYSPGWWFNNILDENGNKTVMYDRVKKVNTEVKRIAEPYMRFRSTQTHFVGFKDAEGFDKVTKTLPVDQLDTGWVRGLKAMDGAPLLVGEMVSRGGGCERGVFVFASDDPWDKAPKAHEIVFSAFDKDVAVFGLDGKVCAKPDAVGVYKVSLKSSEAILICVK